jgi:hypothetical protein
MVCLRLRYQVVKLMSAFPEGKLIDGPKPIAIWLAPSNLCTDISVAMSRRGECEIATAQRRGLNTCAKLRAACQIFNKELSNLICPNEPLPVITNQRGIFLIERDEPFDVSSVGAFDEELLKIIWFFRRFMH